MATISGPDDYRKQQMLAQHLKQKYILFIEHTQAADYHPISKVEMHTYHGAHASSR
jgi:hypothetical protein